jgi:hypothetical protein
VSMDAEAACILCNWASGLPWPFWGLGALGAAGAAAAGGFFGGGGYSSGGADNAGADDSNPDLPPKQYGPPIPPGLAQYQRQQRFPEYSTDVDSSGRPYWPGVSAIPTDGVCSPRTYPGQGPNLNYPRGSLKSLPLGPNGYPIWPPYIAPTMGPNDRVTTGSGMAGRG